MDADLLQHQVAVVRRVLEDPVQRYRLADEVGLGQTIEACTVVRQHLIGVLHPAFAKIADLLRDQPVAGVTVASGAGRSTSDF